MGQDSSLTQKRRNAIVHMGLASSNHTLVGVTYFGRGETHLIDFSFMTKDDARASNPIAFQHVIDFVKPERDVNRRTSIRELWWRFGWERPLVRRAIDSLPRS